MGRQSSQAKKMIKQVLQAFADDNFNDKHYPITGTSSSDVKPFTLVVKRKRNIFKLPFTKSEFIIIGGLEKYVKEDKKEEFLKCVKAKKQTVNDLEIAEYDEEDEQPKSYTEIGLKVADTADGNLKISYDLGELELGKLDKEYFNDPDLESILQGTELDTEKMRRFENEKLYLIDSVIYSERFELKGKRQREVVVDAGVHVPDSIVPLFQAKARASLKKKTVPPKAAKKRTRGPVYYKFVHVDYDKAKGKLKLPPGKFVGADIRPHRAVGDEDDTEDSETVLAFDDEENDLAVPPEILARGHLALRAYNNALSEGRTFVKRVPIMVIGQDRSGKTSLKKSLRGQAFNPDEESTVGIDVDPSHFKVSTEVWKTGEKDQETSVSAISYEHHAAQLIAGSLMMEEQVLEGDIFASNENQKPEKRGLEPVRRPGGSILASTSNPSESNTDSKPPDALRDDVSNLSELHEEGAADLPEEIATLVERLLHKVKTVDEDEEVYSVLWDFGGQSVYYVTHPLFLTPRAIYLLVNDLSRNPHDKANPLVKQGMFKKIEDNFSLKTNLDYLDFWMTSVASLASLSGQQPLSSNSVVIPEALPPVFLVCTHSDEPYGGGNPNTAANEIFDILQNKPYSAHLFEHVFVVDNTKSGGKSECPEVSRLRQKLLEVAKDLPQMTEAIPIKWLQFEKALQVMKEEGREWITLERAKEIASQVCKIDDDQVILTMLNFFHDQRILIHFDDTPELNKLVVLDAQWLIDVFKKVITVKPCVPEEKELKDLWRKLEKTGILEEKLLKHAWSDQKETSESLVAIMEKFSLMCLWPSSVASCTKQYLVPSMLMSHPPEDIVNLFESAQIPSLFLKFSSQIPPSLFPRLVVQFFQWCADEFSSVEKPKLHHNFARFYISQDVDCSVALFCHPSSIEVAILSENLTIDLHDGSQSNVSYSTDQSQRTFEMTVARAVRRQLVLLLDCMKKELCWLTKIGFEVCFLCPTCSRGGTVNYCENHRAKGCSQQECLHFWSESELGKFPQGVICRKTAGALKTRVQVDQFGPWVILSEQQSTLGEGSAFSILEEEDSKEMQASEVQALTSAQDALSQSCDAQEVVRRILEDLQLKQSCLNHPEPKTKKMIRCLARRAKCSSRLDVVKCLREVTEAGTTGPLLNENVDVRDIPPKQIWDLSVDLCGGDEWKMVAERLDLKPSEIRFLDRRFPNPFEPALIHSRKQQYLNVGQLYDVLVDCGFPLTADLL